MAPLPSTKVTYDSPTALKVLIDEATVELRSEKFRYAERTAHYIEVTWQQFLSYCHSRGLEKYLPKCKDEFLADLCSRTPALKASTIKRKASHMKMLDVFVHNGTWEKGNLDPLQELLPEFNAYLDAQEKHFTQIGRSECTCRTMREHSYRILRCFQNEGLKNLADIGESHISSFVLSLKGHAKISSLAGNRARQWYCNTQSSPRRHSFFRTVFTGSRTNTSPKLSKNSGNPSEENRTKND